MAKILSGLVERLGITGRKKDVIVAELKANKGSVHKREEGTIWVTGKLGHRRLREFAG